MRGIASNHAGTIFQQEGPGQKSSFFTPPLEIMLIVNAM